MMVVGRPRIPSQHAQMQHGCQLTETETQTEKTKTAKNKKQKTEASTEADRK